MEHVEPGGEVRLRDLVPAVAAGVGCGATKARELLEQVIPAGQVAPISGLVREQTGQRGAWMVRREAPES